MPSPLLFYDPDEGCCSGKATASEQEESSIGLARCEGDVEQPPPESDDGDTEQPELCESLGEGDITSQRHLDD